MLVKTIFSGNTKADTNVGYICNDITTGVIGGAIGVLIGTVGLVVISCVIRKGLFYTECSRQNGQMR